MQVPGVIKFMKTEGTMVVAKDWEKVRIGSWVLNG